MGSMTQQRGPCPDRPSSSPSTASRGRARRRRLRRDSSVARSASDTGVRSGFCSTLRSSALNRRVVMSSAASARTCAKRRSSSPVCHARNGVSPAGRTMLLLLGLRTVGAGPPPLEACGAQQAAQRIQRGPPPGCPWSRPPSSSEGAGRRTGGRNPAGGWRLLGWVAERRHDPLRADVPEGQSRVSPGRIDEPARRPPPRPEAEAVAARTRRRREGVPALADHRVDDPYGPVGIRD